MALTAAVMPEAALARRQAADTVQVRLPEVRVEATRGAVRLAEDAPFSLSVEARDPAAIEARVPVTSADLLGSIPGVYASGRGHWALGDRITVRGMGARAGFGVRGVQLVLDGVPLTLPDGQSVTELIEPQSITRIEVLRGPASRFWGNGSGGVLFFDSGSEQPGVRGRFAGGSHGSMSGYLAGSGRNRATWWHGWAAAHRTDGYRAHAEGRLFRAGASARTALGSSVLRLVASVADQDVLAPGSLTPAEAENDPRQADGRYAATSSGKRSRQGQAGVSWMAPAGAGQVEMSAWGVTRDLRNPLPFSWIGVDRVAGGLRAAWTGSVQWLDVSVGADVARQRDDRVNRTNDGGQPTGDPSLQQVETVRSQGIGLSASSRGPLGLQAGLRYDRLSVHLDDRLQGDGDQTGSRRFGAWSPSLAAVVRWNGGSAFAGWSTAFETPTTTELVNRADGLGGFNPDVGPQRTRGIESGLRARVARIDVDIAVFAITVDDLLAPFQSDVDGRTYYANAGEARSRGVEARFAIDLGSASRVAVTGWAQRYRFTDGGHVVPGVPERQVRLDARVPLPGGMRAAASLTARSRLFGDDAGTWSADGCSVADLSVDRPFSAGAAWRPFVSIGNVTDAPCAASVVPNARGGRFVEPGFGRTLTLGISLGR